jgi:hypothetical protein
VRQWHESAQCREKLHAEAFIDSCQLVGFGIGSLKTDDDATNRANAAAGVQPEHDRNRPAQGSVGGLGEPKKHSIPSVEKPEPSLDDRSLARLRDEKAARFAIACFLAQQ